MSFIQATLNAQRPAAIRTVNLPRRVNYFPSPADWRNETLYFLLVDRFSDGLEAQRPLLDRTNLAAARPANWRWDLWSQSGGERWQGGNLGGVASKLDYLKNLGVTTIWLSPVFKQRGHLNSFHGYGIQDFLDIDPHFGDRKALVDLVALAHSKGMRIILDIIFNHSGENWTYPADLPGGKFQPHYTSGRHAFGAWRGEQGEDVGVIASDEQGVWPSELQDPDKYTRAGAGNLGAGSIDDPQAEHKRTDFITLKDFNLDHPQLMNELASCFKYWIALCDCDGFRIDTLKHVSFEQARNFCGTIKEFAANLGKSNFFLVGEIAGGDFEQDRYLNVLSRNLNAALDIGGMRITLNQVAKGLQHPADYFAGLDSAVNSRDENLPGFGPFGTVGHHCFDPASSAYIRIQAMAQARAQFPALRVGRQYLRPITFLGNPFAVYGDGEIIAWSRILDDEEFLIVLNPHGTQMRGADILIDSALNPLGSVMTVVVNTAQAADANHLVDLVGSSKPVRRLESGIHCVEIRNLGPAEILVLMNRV